MIAPTSWSPDRVCFHSQSHDVTSLARAVYDRTCRVNFSAPGFCLLNAGNSMGSIAFRQFMVELKSAMAAIHEQLGGKTLIYLSAARFDQQNSTKPHLDGGPDESFLMLGYEPSEVDAELEISDYTRCAADLGISPRQFIAKHNPMFRAGYELLRPYSTRIPCFSPTDFQIVAINNSSAPIDGKSWLGTMHTATIRNPDDRKRRIIDSTMIAPAPIGADDAISPAELQEFIYTSLVHRRGYEKQHLADDT
jgi:hypothetical protein